MASGGEGVPFDVGINLTALLDVLTNLLFFLLFGYAAQQHSVEVDGTVHLPESTAELEPKKDVELVVSPQDIRVDGRIVARIRGGEVVAETDSEGRILPLYKALVERRDRTGIRVEGNILFVLCDKDMPYKALRRVMTTATQAGFAKYRLAALMQ